MEDMSIFPFLRLKKNEMLAEWLDRTLDGYAAPGFFKQARDGFANPVGSNTREALERLWNLLTQDEDPVEFRGALDQLLRIRAVQEFSPSQAVAPVLEIKWVVRRMLARDKAGTALRQELDIFDLRVERAALAAFDVYAACREALYQVRLDEYKSGRQLLTRAVCPSALARRQGAVGACESV